MENNIVKENYLEIIKNREIIQTVEPNVLPMVVEDRSTLMPVIITDYPMIEIKTDNSSLKENKKGNLSIRLLKFLAKFFAKTVRFSYIAISNIIVFAATAVVIVASIAVITKNAVNAYYNIEQPDDSTYSVFEIRDK